MKLSIIATIVGAVALLPSVLGWRIPDTQPQGLWRNSKREIEADAGPEKLFAVGVSRQGMNFTEFNEGVEDVARVNQTGVPFQA